MNWTARKYMSVDYLHLWLHELDDVGVEDGEELLKHAEYRVLLACGPRQQPA